MEEKKILILAKWDDKCHETDKVEAVFLSPKSITNKQWCNWVEQADMASIGNGNIIDVLLQRHPELILLQESDWCVSAYPTLA